jgi:hypothetical protein
MVLIAALIVAILWWLITGDCYQFFIVIAAAVATAMIAVRENRHGGS